MIISPRTVLRKSSWDPWFCPVSEILYCNERAGLYLPCTFLNSHSGMNYSLSRGKSITSRDSKNVDISVQLL